MPSNTNFSVFLQFISEFSLIKCVLVLVLPILVLTEQTIGQPVGFLSNSANSHSFILIKLYEASSWGRLREEDILKKSKILSKPVWSDMILWDVSELQGPTRCYGNKPAILGDPCDVSKMVSMTWNLSQHKFLQTVIFVWTLIFFFFLLHSCFPQTFRNWVCCFSG